MRWKAGLGKKDNLGETAQNLRAIFVSVRKKHVLVSCKAQNPSSGWWRWLVLQRRR
jgi:hypothetical protein